MKKQTFGIIVLVIAVVVAAYVLFGDKLNIKKQTVTQTPVTQNTSQGSSPCKGSPTTVSIMTGQSTLGNYLADSQCRTLYVTSADKANESDCNDACAQTWPPFLYDGTDLQKASDPLYRRLNLIKRKDGSYQYEYGTSPLYHYKNDTVAGDMKGNSVNKAWSIILLDKQGTK